MLKSFSASKFLMAWETALDKRPLSEYLLVYHQSRKRFQFLYYCRGCMRNFDSEHRTSACPRCGKADITELPKEMVKSSGFDMRFDMIKPKLAAFVTRTRCMLYRIKIVLLWVTTRVPKVEE